MTTLILRPSKVAATVVVGLGALCVIALISSDLDRRLGVAVLFLIYGQIRRAWLCVQQRHPRAVIQLIQHAASHWESVRRSGERVQWVSHSSTVVTRYLVLLQGFDAQQRRHSVLLFSDSVPLHVWRHLVGALRLRSTLVAMGQFAFSE